MARRVFLDIGAHQGETLDEVIRPAWSFDRIVCFEPASSCWSSIVALADDRVQLVRAGLWDRDTEMELHDPGRIGASLTAGKAVSGDVETCTVLDAGRWFAENLLPDDIVFAKINVEGAECDLIDRLAATGQLRRLAHLLVHFDVLKIHGQEHRAGEAAAVLDASGIDWIDARRIMFGRSHGLKTANWLRYAESARLGRLWQLHAVRLVFRARQAGYRARERVLSR